MRYESAAFTLRGFNCQVVGTETALYLVSRPGTNNQTQKFIKRVSSFDESKYEADAIASAYSAPPDTVLTEARSRHLAMLHPILKKM